MTPADEHISSCTPAHGGSMPRRAARRTSELADALADCSTAHGLYARGAHARHRSPPTTRAWGYQVTGYYAPTSRYGDPDDFKYLVDRLHHSRASRVIMDWVPGALPRRSEHGLRRFGGTPLFESQGAPHGGAPRMGNSGVRLCVGSGAELPRFVGLQILRGISHRRHPCRRGKLDAVSRLRPPPRRVYAEPKRREYKPRRSRIPAEAEFDGAHKITPAP